MHNPLLERFETPFETVPFDLIKNKHFLPALQEAIKRGKQDIEKIKQSKEKPTFNNVCEALDMSGYHVNVVSSVFFNLNSAESSEELQGIAKEFSPMLTEYCNDIDLDAELFEKVKLIYDQKDKLNLSPEEMTLLKKQYSEFVRGGALLKDSDKEKLREIEKEKSSLSLVFDDNVLKETNDFVMLLEEENDLKGLPDGAKEAAKLEAKSRGHEGKWAITLDYPSYGPFMTYAEDRTLREKLFKAYGSRACKGNAYDNSENVKKIANLRYDRARLLGYKSHAQFVLEERMASTPEKVDSFLSELMSHAKPAGAEEVEELKAYALENGHKGDLERWDVAFWSERLKQSKFDIDDEKLRPYFKLDDVIDGVFGVAERLYGLKFKHRKDIPVYHEDVRAYEVTDEKDKHIAVFYADFFPRAGKRGGAWMTYYRDQRKVEGADVRPHVAIVCNFTKPTEDKPSLLTFREVQTLFHEFGHSLHCMLSNCTYHSLSGTSVYWDFVELPSQLLENWTYEKECLDTFAVHYKTGEKIPGELVKKLKESSAFHEGMHTMRQLGLGLVDMGWHRDNPEKIKDVAKFEESILKDIEYFPPVEGSTTSCDFSHIFTGGYSAGYYSYKWAEVLDADTFEMFKEHGIFSKEVASKFRSEVLEKGGSEHPMILYKRFRGHEPTPEPLLRRAGLIK